MKQYRLRNKLRQIKFLQEETIRLQNEHLYISLKKCWEILTAEKKCYVRYETYIRYLGESYLNTRIAEDPKEPPDKSQPTLFD